MNKTILSIMAVATLAMHVHAAEFGSPMQDVSTGAPTMHKTHGEAQKTPQAAPESALSKLSVKGSFSYESAFVFRGVKYTESAFQATVEAGYPVCGGDLYVGTWINQPIASGEFNEIDFYVGWMRPLTETLSVDLGYAYYWYPDTQAGVLRSNEMHIGLSYDTTGILGGVNLSPSIIYYYDCTLESHVVEFAISYSFDLSDLVGVAGLSLDPSAYVGWGTIGMPEAEWGPSGWSSGFYYGANLNLCYQLNDYVGFYAGVRWAGSTATNEYTENPQHLWGGVGVNFGL